MTEKLSEPDESTGTTTKPADDEKPVNEEEPSCPDPERTKQNPDVKEEDNEQEVMTFGCCAAASSVALILSMNVVTVEKNEAALF